MIIRDDDLGADGLFALVHDDGDYVLSASLPEGAAPGSALSIGILEDEERLVATLSREDVAKLREALIQHWMDTSEEGFFQGIDASKLSRCVFECWSSDGAAKLRVERFDDDFANDGLAFLLGGMKGEDGIHYDLGPVRVLVAKLGLSDIHEVWWELKRWLEATA